jgi:uncharacterized membrane protein
LAVLIGLCGTGLAQNPIVLENQQAGTSAWQGQGKIGSDATGQMKAYASATSVNKGGNITFYVSVNPSQTYTMDVYRVGWYQGLGGRLMQHIGPLNGTPQPVCPVTSGTGLIECHWAAGYTLTTQTTWTSGVYLVLLTNSQGFENYSHFVLRDDSRVADFVYQLPVNTYQAYNDYPYDNSTGKSIYAFNSYGANTVGGSAAAVKLSFDRPYNYDGDCGVWGHCVLGDAAPFIHWLEKSGYDVSYITDVDTHENPGRWLNYKGFISGGHNEYWSKAMYDGAIAAVNAGVNLGFFYANSVYTQIRYESSSTGVADRVMVCYRDPALDPNPDPTLKTINWRDDPVNRPEQTLVGVQYTSQVPVSNQGFYATFVVNNSNNWVYSGTGFQNNNTVPGLVGYEADRVFSEFPGPNAVAGTSTLLSHSPFSGSNGADFSSASIYQATSGAWVFASGTMNWVKGLDNFDLGGGPNLVDPRIQQATTNILNQFLGNTPPDFTLAATPASQTVAPASSTTYNSSITPKGAFGGNVTMSVSGLPSGATASFSPNPTTSSSVMTVTTGASTPLGTYTLTVTGVSGSLSHTAQVTLVVSQPDFTIGATPSSQLVLQGGSTSFTVNLGSLVGFNGQVTLSVAGLPIGATGTFTPNPATSSSSLAISTLSTTALGSYPLTITGVSGALTHSTTVTLVVSAPDFSVSASPATNTVTQGSSVGYGVTITPLLGFTGQVSLSVSGLPTGATGTFTPNPATSSSTLSVGTTASTPTGTYTLTITGTSGALIHTTTVSLTVTPAGVVFDNKGSSGYQFGVTSITTPAFTIGSGSNRAAMIMVAMGKNTATGITASLGGVAGTLVPGTDSGTTATVRTMIFQVINPPSGSQTAKVQWTTSMNADVGVITVSGANQSGPVNNGTFFASNSAASAGASIAITSNNGDLTASVGYTNDSWKSPFTNRTLKWGVDASEVGGDIGPGTGTTTHTWTDSFAFQTVSVSGANFQGASAPDYTVGASPSSQTVTQGNPTSYNVTVTPKNGFSGQVNLAVSGLPTGATGSFSPNPTSSTSTLSVTTSATTPPGSYTLTLTGTSGILTRTTTTTLAVVAPDFSLGATPSSQTVIEGNSTNYNLTITPANGFSGSVNFAVSGLPTAATASFTPNPATSTATMAVTADPTTPAGSYTLTITGTSGALTHTTTVTLVVTAPDFSLSGTPSSQSVTQGNTVPYTVTINPINTFSGSVNLAVSGLPTGATGSFTTNPATSSSTLNVTAGAATPAGSYTVTITGTSGSLTHTTTVTLVVIAPDFTLSATPSSQTVLQGNSATYNVTINPVNSFSGSVNLAVSGLPTGASGSFATNPATTSSALTFTAGAATPPGTYTLTITGTSGSLTHTTTVTVVIPTPDFSLSPSPSTQLVVQGNGTSYNLTINPLNGFSGSVNFSIAGLPTGASGSFTPNPGTLSSSLAVQTASNTPAGSYTLTITGTSGTLTRTTTVTLVVSLPPDFGFGASPSSQTVVQGASTTYNVTITPQNGFSGQATLSVSGLPTGATGTFSINPATSTSVLTVATSGSSPVGSYPLTITAVSGALTHTANVTLVVATPDFSVSASPSTNVTTQGGSATYGVTITPMLGFNSPVTFGASGLPTGATATFTPNPATTTSSMVITTGSTTPTGTYTITITGISGALTHATTVSLTVNPAGVIFDNKVSSGIQWGVTKITTPAFTIGTGSNRAAMIMVAMSGNNATGVTATLGGVAGTLVPGTDSGTGASIRTMIFQVINPPSGSQTAVVSWTTSMNADVGVITVSGTSQTTPVINGTFFATNSNSGAAASVTITSNPGDLTASIGFTADGWKTPFTNRTLKWGVDSAEVGGDIGPGTGTTTHTWTDSFSFQSEVVAGANFKAGP